MKIDVKGMGTFPATETESKYLEGLSGQLPELSPIECLLWMYLSRCLQLARSSESRLSPSGHHVLAIDLLGVAELAALQIFGSAAREWLVALGVRSSRDFGRVVYRFVEVGALDITRMDRKEDFDSRSVFDDFIQAA